ncbi:hypothetical protein [Hyalangium sp.]|nr:hypothetical protein [Hyalangium sp.]HYH99329.1 hypothetical protein [Hyalangium sp.]
MFRHARTSIESTVEDPDGNSVGIMSAVDESKRRPPPPPRT